MENLSVIVLVVSVICAAAVQDSGSCFDTCALSETLTTSSCAVEGCTCASSVVDHGTSTCDPSCDIAIYQVEFDAANSNCSTYFDDTNFANWTFKAFSHNSSCNITEGCCNETIGGCFDVMGLNGMLNVTKDYPYASVIIEFGGMDSVELRVGASLLQPCNGLNWLPDFTACAEYFGPATANGNSNTCDQCGPSYNFGCFEFTLMNTSGCSDTPSSPSPMATPSATPSGTPSATPLATPMATPMATPTATHMDTPVATMGNPPTTPTTTGTSSGSNVTHSLGLTLILLVLLKLF